MLGSYSQNVISAKARSMYGKRLTDKDYTELTRKRSVSEVAGYLKNETAYRTCLASINESLIHRGQLEQILRTELFNRYAKLCRYQTGKTAGSFYHYTIINIEITAILNCIRLLNAGKPEEFLFSMPAFLLDHARFEMSKLNDVRSFSDLLSVLSATPYKAILQRLQPEPGMAIDVTRCEHALREYYFHTVIDLIKRDFKGSARRELTEIFSLQCELINVTIIYRMKKYFHASPDTIRSLMLPYTYYISRKQLDALIEANGEKEAMKIVMETRYSKQVQEENFSFIEHFAQSVLYELNKRRMRYTTHAPTVMVSYMVLCEIETENIIDIIEGIRYNVSPAEIEKLLYV